MTRICDLLLFSLLFFTLTGLSAQTKPKSIDLEGANEQENLNVFQQWIRWNNPGSVLMHHLIAQADVFYAVRDREIEKLTTREDWLERQKQVKAKLMKLVGPFPEKTPINARITGILKKEGFRVEKLLYEAMPGYQVTGCLFVPDKLSGKAPAILNVIGHSQDAFRADLYQTIILNLVKKGMIVLAIDPPGQGERVQYFDPETGLSSVGYSVIEHCYFGNQCFLSGSCCAKYFIWEGIRAIDYLLSRKEVDPSRIGVTGLSGGGTITSYVSAFDDRVSVSVPCSWATACKRQLETKGAQDAETEFWRGVAEGITFEDLLEVRAPKPTLMTFTSRDQYLSLQGAREAWLEGRKAYRAFGKEENIQLVEDDYKHWLTPKLRRAIYDFFIDHFNLPGDPAEEDVELISKEELKVTPTGQISTSLNSRMIFDVNSDETVKLLATLEESRKNIEHHLRTVPAKAREISGYQSPGDAVKEPFINGRYQREGYVIEKIAIRGEGNYTIPMLLFIPDHSSARHPALVCLHADGKAVEARPGGELEKLVKKGYVVAAADVIGVGEIKDQSARGLATGYTGVLIGRSIPGIQAGDIVRTVNYLKTRPEVSSERIGAIGIGNTCIALMHAAAFDQSIKNVVLIGSPVSYRSVVMNRHYKLGVSAHNKGAGHPHEVDFTWGIAGVLTGYDLPDLIGCMAPRKVTLIGLKDHMLEPASNELIKTETEFPAKAYAAMNVPENLKIVTDGSWTDFADWGFE